MKHVSCLVAKTINNASCDVRLRGSLLSGAYHASQHRLSCEHLLQHCSSAAVHIGSAEKVPTPWSFGNRLGMFDCALHV